MIVSQRLRIRPLEADDAEAVFHYRSDPAVCRYQNWEPASVEEVRSFITGLEEIGIDTPGRWYQVGLWMRETGQLVGDCGIHVQEQDPRQVEIGITLAPEYQGCGLASEGLEAVLGFLFTTLGKHRVFGSVDPRNRRSLALLERAGLRREAHFVESLWFKGDWADDVIYAILQREYLARQRA